LQYLAGSAAPLSLANTVGITSKINRYQHHSPPDPQALKRDRRVHGVSILLTFALFNAQRQALASMAPTFKAATLFLRNPVP